MTLKVEKTDVRKQSQPDVSVLPNAIPGLHSIYLYIAGTCNLACRLVGSRLTFHQILTKALIFSYSH
jgi:hypothetical protein